MTVPISGDPTISGVVLTEQPTTPASPASGKRKLFVDTSGTLKVVNSGGTVSSVAGATLDAVGDVNAPAPTDGQVLTWQAAPGAWVAATPAAAGMTNPMTTQDDLVVGGASGAPTRLAKGTDGQVLTVDPTTHHLVWATPAAGGGGGYGTIQDEGTALTARTALNVVGRAVVADDSGSVTRLRIGDALTTCYVCDDFLTGQSASASVTVGAINWIATSGGGTTAPQAGEAGHPGIVRLSTGAVVNAITFLYALSTTAFVAAEVFDVLVVFRQNTADTTNGIRIGLGQLWTAEPSNAVYLEKLAADTSWFGTARTGGASTRTAALAAVDTAWHRVRVRRVDASTVGFTLDALTEVTLATGIPTAGLVLGMHIFNSAANNAARTLDVDFADLLITGLSR